MLLRVSINGIARDCREKPPNYADKHYLYKPPKFNYITRGRNGKVKVLTREEIARLQAEEAPV